MALALATLGASAKAATFTTSSGDLILSFRDKSNTVQSNLEVDLGLASNFVTFATNNPGGTLNLDLNGAYYGANGGLAVADLTSVYGDNWNSNSSLVWSVAGVTNQGAPSVNLFLTFPGTPDNRSSAATYNNTASGRINGVRVGLNGATALTGPTSGQIASTLSSSYSVEIRNGNPGSYSKDYNFLTHSTESGVVSDGSISLELYQYTAGSGAPTDLGTFTLGSNGDLAFTAAIPEPSTYAMFAIGGFGILFLYRRGNRMIKV